MKFPDNVKIITKEDHDSAEGCHIPLIHNFLYQAYISASKSQDTSTQIGTVIISLEDQGIIGEGCNNLPYGVVSQPERLQRPEKYIWTEHSERNAIFEAARLGNSTMGNMLFCNCFACPDCARAIIQAGIDTCIGHYNAYLANGHHWQEGLMKSFQMFKEANVSCVVYKGNVPFAPKIRMNGVEFDPANCE